ncbi:hypothetical protein [Clostridioides sp. ES-S-0049-03]
MRLVDMLMSIPSFLVLIVLNTYLAPKASIKKLSQLLVH